MSNRADVCGPWLDFVGGILCFCGFLFGILFTERKGYSFNLEKLGGEKSCIVVSITSTL